MPLGPVEMDYSFTERGSLPEELEASGLAAAFGPEPCADEAPEPKGVSARIQVGDALVSLLEHHHKHRCVYFCTLVLKCTVLLLPPLITAHRALS